VVEVLRGATGEIEDYVRVDLVTDSRDFIPGAAVADVTHLLAELVENAVLYSPPQTRVQVKASRVANGYVVEIEDRGLGIPAETLDVLNERLARPPEFDLADSDQLGLFVVGRLAARHEIKVSLRGSPYGGTTAIVLMPHRLVVADADSAPAIGQHATGPGPGREPAGEPPVTGPRLTLGPETASGPPGSVQTRLPAWSASSDQVPAHDASGPDLAGPGSSVNLPRRLRQASLAPQLRDAPSAASSGGRHEVRSAEQARALISSIQQGWRSGQAAADDASGDVPGLDPGARHGEAGE
jgi:hypothetical protein